MERITQLITIRDYCLKQLSNRQLDDNLKRRNQLFEILGDAEAAIAYEEQNYKVTWNLEDE